MATHLACFLLGTLLFEPDTSGRVPSGVLVPWSLQKIQGTLRKTADYELISRTKKCRLSPEIFKLWAVEDKKILVVLPKSKESLETYAAMQKAEAWLEVARATPVPLCVRSNAVVYP